jgi:RimJ/RimL family protein N-acetyltransferase
MLRGKNVLLRPVEQADLSLLVSWRNEPETWACFFNKVPLSQNGQQSWFKALSEDRQRILFIIESLNSHEAIGTIGFDRLDHPNQVAELGNVLIGPASFKHKGFAREATMLLLSYGFERLNLNRIFLNVHAGNSAAIKLYKSCGFQEEGCLRQAFFDEGVFKDILVMANLRTHFRERKLTI